MSNGGSQILDSASDFLSRTQFLEALKGHIQGIAEVPLADLPAPRVLAIDAPWGSGKSWVAGQLARQLSEGNDPFKVISIDAFRYDYQADPFAIIAAAIFKELNPKAAQKRSYIKAVGSVLRHIGPLALKGGLNYLLKTMDIKEEVQEVIDSSEDAISEGGEKLSDKAVEALLNKYANIETEQEEFLKALNGLTAQSKRPIVVLVDELDRCRPSFALEMLERIKHLFSSDKIVFVLFWYSRAIAESVRHTYGRGIEAERYLSKFVALSIALPLAESGREGRGASYERFIESYLTKVMPRAGQQRENFQMTLSALAPAFDASLRDVQRAIHLYRDYRGKPFPPEEFAYFALLYVVDKNRFWQIIKCNKSAMAEEAKRLRPFVDLESKGVLSEIWAVLKYYSNEAHYCEVVGLGRSGENEEDDIVITWAGLKPGAVSMTRTFRAAGDCLQRYIRERPG